MAKEGPREEPGEPWRLRDVSSWWEALWDCSGQDQLELDGKLCREATDHNPVIGRDRDYEESKSEGGAGQFVLHCRLSFLKYIFFEYYARES